MVGRRDHRATGLVGESRQGRAPQIARRLLEGRPHAARSAAAGGLGIDPEPVEREGGGPGEGLDVVRIEIGLPSAQAVVYVAHDQLEREGPGGAPEQIEQHTRVAPAGYGDEHTPTAQILGRELARKRTIETRA